MERNLCTIYTDDQHVASIIFAIGIPVAIISGMLSIFNRIPSNYLLNKDGIIVRAQQ